ncbi:G-alpha-domain-containing protein [Daedalea quercina L-15889]|uniref:G-alpha-domain-containing protein n=1 Tax=Daedalea quercina L-15889 TaxID=1314783 RepID=A0A165N794_9APHY|nr:G-alpha-domain-containing protein [Daedalea quercina L-15889]
MLLNLGKSTTLKNFQLTFAPQAWAAERASWRAVVQLNLVRSINLILDTLAQELAAHPPARPRTGTSLFSTVAVTTHASHSATPSPDSLTGPSFARDSSEIAAAGAPLQFTDKHALLKLRLAPLRYVENDLRRVLGAASSDGAVGSAAMHAPPFDEPYAGGNVRSVRGADLCLRSNRSWKDALHTQYQYQYHGSGHSHGHGGRETPAVERDDATEVIAGCREDMKTLWEDEVVRDMLARQRMRIEDSAGFFLDDIDRIATRSYEPSDDDVVRARLRTVGVQEYQLNFENTAGVDRSIAREWIIYDVGGARSARAAWVPYFEDAHALLFLAPINCFDESLEEDRHVNRLEDSFMIWKGIVSSKLLRRCIIVLFLNKYDLLARKLKGGVTIRKYLSSFGDRENTAPVFAKYLHSKFREQHKEYSPEPRSFYGYVTCVIDTKATASTLSSVRDGLLQQHLQKADLVA